MCSALIWVKQFFHLVGLDSTGKVVIRKRCSRRQLLAFTANLQVQLIGMESCSGSHFLGRALREQGHEVRLMPAQYVKPYVQTNKSDYLDAEASAEAVQRPRMRFVPIKTEDQLDLQALHRVRERWVMRRTAVVDQIPQAPERGRRGLGKQIGSHGHGRSYVRTNAIALPLFLCPPKISVQRNSSCQVCSRKIEMAMGQSHVFGT
jgi:transposase